jgi:hypothetical protein
LESLEGSFQALAPTPGLPKSINKLSRDRHLTRLWVRIWLLASDGPAAELEEAETQIVITGMGALAQARTERSLDGNIAGASTAAFAHQ